MLFCGFFPSLSFTPYYDVIMYVPYAIKSFQGLFQFLWNISDAGVMPNGMRLHLYLPNGVENVVRLAESSSSCTCQNPDRTSHFVKTLALVMSGRSSSTVGTGCLLRLRAGFKSCGSIHILRAPLVLCTTTRADVRSVGQSTCSIPPSASRRFSSSRRGSLRAVGMRRIGISFGHTVLSISRCKCPERQPTSRSKTLLILFEQFFLGCSCSCLIVFQLTNIS